MSDRWQSNGDDFLFIGCCINNQHDFKGWGENQRIMLHDKTGIFDLDLLFKNGSRAPESKWFALDDGKGACTCFMHMHYSELMS